MVSLPSSDTLEGCVSHTRALQGCLFPEALAYGQIFTILSAFGKSHGVTLP